MKIETFRFADDGDVPNNPCWPMIVYQGVLAADEADAASAFEALFARHGWGDGWRNGIFAFPHYHSNSHEVLGIASGSALVRLGGGAGREFTIAMGDVVLLPAGTGHQRLSASSDLLVIGAYPPGPRCDLRRAGEVDKDLIRRRIGQVAKPAQDPVAGKNGPAISLWDC